MSLLRASVLTALVCLGIQCAEPRKPLPDPKITSVSPMGGQVGTRFDAVIRGTTLAGARTILFDRTGASARLIQAAETEVRASFEALQPGVHTFRIAGTGGVTNQIAIHAGPEPTAAEGAEIAQLPVAVHGKLAKRGETDSYWITAKGGETVTFEVKSGFPGFDPSVSLWAKSASWFDPERLDRIAANDEPLYFPGLATDARLEHTFGQAGRYCVRVAAFHGQGGPDYVYQLHVSRAKAPPPSLHPTGIPAWPARWFTRRLDPDWISAAARRGAVKPPAAIETYQAVPEGSERVPVMNESGFVVGRLSRADEAHEIRLRITEPRDLAIEVETPEATMPRFNPVVRVMQPDGHEVVTNVYTKRNNNGLYMMKMIQAKSTVTLRAVGEYTIQIRDITSGCWSPDFAYRVLIRPRIPHLGEVALAEDRVNLEAGLSKPLTVRVDREEGFKGFVSISVEGLPAGVTAVPGLENPVEQPPLPNAGRRERYYPVPQTATVILSAAPDAAPGESPVLARVVVRPVVDGVIGDPVLSKELPVMVVARRDP
ncbi:MAG: hypothetical protein FJW39_29625 [Acidobacteria bacterium]|nr:hypothetical protein [Acidobacteriota bacterium]